MSIDANNPVVALCAAGMAAEGTPAAARALFEEAWSVRQDDYDACIAAHYLARHQRTPQETLDWNARAVRHAIAVTDDRAQELLPSLYLNLADSLAALGDVAEANVAANEAAALVTQLPNDGYAEFVAAGIRRLRARLEEGSPARGSSNDR